MSDEDWSNGAVRDPVIGVCATVPARGRPIPVTCARKGFAAAPEAGTPPLPLPCGVGAEPFASPSADLGRAIRPAEGVGATPPPANRFGAGASTAVAEVAERAEAPVI